MSISKSQLAELLKNDRFPRSAKYDPEWVAKGWMGPNVLWLTEWLCERMKLQPGMRVLDMGCGKALSSIFLAKEFAVQVWANDLWISASENWQRVKEAGLEGQVFPIHSEAHALPYADEFFDAIVSLDSYQYYGTDDLYLGYFNKFVKPGGQIGIVSPGLVRDFDGTIPQHLLSPRPDRGTFWVDECWCFHTAEWWRKHWTKYSSMRDVEADVMPKGVEYWIQYEDACDKAGTLLFPSEAETLRADGGQWLAWIRVIGSRR